MYEDLVKRLNAYSAEHENQGGITAEAADAIEWLSMRLHGDEAAIAGMKREIEYMVRAEKPSWIPVGVRLPDVTFSGRDVDGFTENPDGTLSASSYFDIYESKDCLVYGLVEGVVCLSVAKWTIWDFNDGERKDTAWCDSFGVGCDYRKVTHWMPLPEPPEEEKK